MYSAGKRAEALQFVDLLRKSHPNDPIWQLNEAHFRDAIGDPDALKTWITISDAHPGDIRVQYRALSTPSRFADRAFWQRTIDRVKGLTGPDAQAWQVEQAQFPPFKHFHLTGVGNGHRGLAENRTGLARIA